MPVAGAVHPIRSRRLTAFTRQSLKRGVFRSVDDLEKAIARYIAATNKNPRPFVWPATAKAIRTKLAVDHPSEALHKLLPQIVARSNPEDIQRLVTPVTRHPHAAA